MDLWTNGIILHTDEDGYIVKRAAASSVQDKWREPLDRTIAEYVGQFGSTLRSVYVRGSAALGNARDFMSDLDTFALVDGTSQPPRASWDEFRRDVRHRWPFVKEVEIASHLITAVRTEPGLSAMIKTQSACVYGVDVEPSLPRFKPGFDMIFHAWDLPRDLAVAGQAIESASNEGAAEACRWAMKRLLRSGFEIVMERSSCYTRDLVSCYRIFSQYYHDKAGSMANALTLAVEPDDVRARFPVVRKELVDFIYETLCLQYGAARIAQILQLRDPRRSVGQSLHATANRRESP
jgi:hypothetical protein